VRVRILLGKTSECSHELCDETSGSVASAARKGIAMLSLLDDDEMGMRQRHRELCGSPLRVTLAQPLTMTRLMRRSVVPLSYRQIDWFRSCSSCGTSDS
jgi:hypothetical protein